MKHFLVTAPDGEQLRFNMEGTVVNNYGPFNRLFSSIAGVECALSSDFLDWGQHLRSAVTRMERTNESLHTAIMNTGWVHSQSVFRTLFTEGYVMAAE